MSDWTRAKHSGPAMSAMLPLATVGLKKAPVVMGQQETHALQQKASYSITSSARASKEGGTVRPSALAVLRLITNSNLVGCSTGRSEGLVPLRILST